MQIGVGWIFIRWLLNSERGPKENRKDLVIAGLFGMLAVAIAIFLELKLIPDDLTTHAIRYTSLHLLNNGLIIGLIEEGAKAFPLAIYLLLRKKINEVTDGMLYFGISGMVFGVIEDIGYNFSLGPGAGIAKIVSGPFIHAGFSVLIGWALSMAILRGRQFWLLVPAGLAAAIGLHGLYDFGLFYATGWSVLMSLVITVFVNLNILLLMRSAVHTDGKLGLASVGDNLYCRQCGKPNPQHFVYCIYCGRKT